MSRSSQNGFLIKNGAIIEKLASAKRIFFDKTGTITDGQISLDAIHPTSEISAQELLTLAYTLEQSSSHILAKAVTAHATENGLAPLALENLQEIPGQGVQAQVGGHDVKVGRATFVGGPTDLNYETAIYVSRDGSYLGAITFSDTVRPEAREVMSDLSGLGLQDITMLTGDNAIVAKKIAGQVGIQDIYANLLPGQKLEHIKDATPKPTIMVGDGVNDAPALTLADVGISVGTGNSTVASEAADVVLLKNDLTSVVKAITISRDTMRIARQSVLIGIFICVILMLVAATGVIPAIIGAFCQEIVDVVSILYALRALKG
jgi:cation transport ATPase